MFKQLAPQRRYPAVSSARWLLIALLALLLIGCQRVELYSSLSEREGNEILAVLLNNGIPATKSRAKEFVAISVPQTEVALAIKILTRQGLPRERFTDLGQIFQKQGLISSPMEERVRYTYGLSQMLAETLTKIDGVLSARVLIVLPEAATFGQEAAPSSASVFIRYLADWEIEDFVPRIKMLVQNSVDGLSYENISVALFPQHAPPQIPLESQTEIATGMPLPWFAAGAGLLLLLSLGANAYFWRRIRRATGTMPLTLDG